MEGMVIGGSPLKHSSGESRNDPGDSLARLNFLRIASGVFCVIILLCLVPVWLVPTLQGADKHGRYTLPRNEYGDVPIIDKQQMTVAVVLILIPASCTFFAFLFFSYQYAKRKEELGDEIPRE